MHAKSADLLRHAREGDEQARGRLLENYRDYLGLLARMEIGKRLQTKVDPADLVQETFLEAHRHFQNFRGAAEYEFAAWLREILAARISNQVRHYVGTQARDVRRERELVVDLDQSSRMLDRGLQALQATPSQDAVRQEQGVLLARALQKLPADYREVVVLRQLEELPFQEVADRMQRTVDSVQKIWVRALIRLRQLLQETADD